MTRTPRHNFRVAASIGLALLSAGAAVHAEAIRHPLDPLSSAEIERAVAVIKASGRSGSEMRFGLIELKEPPKAQVWKDLASGRARRSAVAILYDWATGTTSEAVVDLGAGSLTSWAEVATGEPPTSYVTLMRLREAVFPDPRWQKGLARIGLTQNSGISLMPAAGVYAPIPVVNGQRVIDAGSYMVNGRAGPSPVKDLPFKFTVNLTTGTVTTFEDTGDELSREATEVYAPEVRRPALKPLGITQPDGPSFVRNGSRVEWQNWVFHYGVNPRRGLEIYDVAYQDGERHRPVLYRASLAEMITPYGDPKWMSWYPSDEGDLNLVNYSLMSAVIGEDAPPNVVFDGAISHHHLGAVVEYDRAVSLFERDGGILWRHWNEARRARELVLSSYFAVDNYDYALSWIFHQDGTIEVEVLLSGIINAYDTERLSEADPQAAAARVRPADAQGGA